MTNLPELAIIKYILIYNIYIKYIDYIHISSDYKEIKMIYDTLEILHKKFPESDKTVDELEVFFYANYPRMSKKDRENIEPLFQKIKSCEVSNERLLALLEDIRQRALARRAAVALLEASEIGGNAWEKSLSIISEISSYQTSSPTLESSNFVTSNLYELRSATVGEGGLHWPLRSLNMSLGPLRGGDFGFIFARPESGKTTFLAHTTACFAQQVDRPGVWFNNEEQGEKVRVRSVQATLGLTTDELFGRDIEQHQASYNKNIGGRLLIYDDASISKRIVESIITDIKPSFIVFDQIDKIQGFSADRQDLVYGRIYQWARELAKTYACPVIGVCQSDGTGEGIKWLTMSHVADAKTSKQAEADWILGIGRSNEEGTQAVRYFNISKNKLMGSEGTDPELRHGRFDVWIYPETARYGDILE